jgi:hypothetical protein
MAEMKRHNFKSVVVLDPCPDFQVIYFTSGVVAIDRLVECAMHMF